MITVAELIEKLKQLPPELPVTCEDAAGYCIVVSSVEVRDGGYLDEAEAREGPHISIAS